MKTTIYTKLLQAKKQIGKIHKNSENPHFRKKYADINAILEIVEPVLLENNLILLQPIINNKVVTQIIDSETGEKLESILELDGTFNPQQKGSQISYYRRYSLQSILSLQVTEDDDANSVSLNQPKKETSKPTTKPNLTDRAMQQAVERISNGESDLIEKLKKAFIITEEQESILKSMLNGK